MWRLDSDLFSQVFRSFCTLVLTARLGFEGVDAPARKIFQVDRVAKDPQIRHLTIATLAELGRNYNRFLVRNLVVQIFNDTRSGPLLTPTISGLRESESIDWVLAESDPDDYASELRGWLRELLRDGAAQA